MAQLLEDLFARDARLGEEFLQPKSPSGSLARTSCSSAVDPLIGQIFGAFTIQEPIARGGMGTVYLAEQSNPRRPVALKIMQSNAWAESAVRRFDVESRILAYLRHPNIAQVYEAGTHRLEGGATFHFFAMEFVPDARTIIRYAADHSLSVRDRLELFLEICDAIHHGHQKGIIHRDLKPSNIIVGNDGRAKVIDFGIARLTDSDIAKTTMHTEAGQLLGTLAYMSPEQCSADPSQIDTSTDIYSLGVILFELLSGRMPYDVSNMTIQSAARIICEKEPTHPSLFNNKLRGDTEIIILKAIEKDRAKRYSSAAALADDIKLHLRGESIAACPPTKWTKAVRWAARHPVLTTAAMCVIISLSMLGASTLSVWYLTLRPNCIVLFRNGKPLADNERGSAADEARLLARNGNELHRWGGASGSIKFAELLNRPAYFGGGRLALIGYTELDTGPLRKLLCAFDLAGNLDEPVWRKGVETAEVLSTLVEKRHFDGGYFHADRGMVADVFPVDTHPGDEIVAVFSCDTSQRVIRIYDLRGELLYEAWHDGAASVWQWMSTAGLLACTTDDHQRNWDELGKPNSPDRAPLAAFGLRPSPGNINRDGYLNSNESLALHRTGREPSGLVWYKWLYQEGGKPVSDIECGWTLETARWRDPGRFVTLKVTLRSYTCSVSWTIDDAGNEVPNTRTVDECYKLARQSGNPLLPDPDEFHLGDTPPVTLR